MEKRRDYTKFFTYPETAKFMAEIINPKPMEFVLEPSAGNGALVKAIKTISPESLVVAVELYNQWFIELTECADIVIIRDFLQFESIPKFNHCIANPPFGNGIDLDAHINKMRSMVKKGGKIVVIVPLDYNINEPHQTYDLENWSKNSDGTTTEIKIISFLN